MKHQFKLLLFCLLLLVTFSSVAQDQLLTDFQNPPNPAKPRVWWHWMNGNISKEGIQKDLEWMQRVGIGGFQNFDANLFTPLVVEKKVEFMQPAWDAFRFATQLADSLKITFTTMPFYQASDELLPSGLLGSVTLIQK
ncbi:glycosyl hydrolase [Catalinimonas niigatensis]|uniref:glycosyl hydrolase n=1 Tax=Catalinimonas niigatensis TaxID=1397264 RepID=UPI002AA2B571|nr:glycosyl hydrolase [Catalinimonas niigatensis]WPP49143.1 glycosyl hydrolase [Catalinimonas niigatensis]